jgi:hypothetical protein
MERQTFPNGRTPPVAPLDSRHEGALLAIKRAIAGVGLGAWSSFAALTLLFIGLRWNSYDTPLVRDEGEYGYAAQLLQHGLLPYQHSFLQKPPMVAYSYALAGALVPQVFWAPRMLAYLFAAMATGLLGLIARNEFGPGVALPAMWLVTPMVLLPALEQFTANTEMFILLPLLGMIAVFSFCRSHGGGGWWPWCLAGFLGSVTLCYKYTALPVLVWIFGAWSFERWRPCRHRAKNLPRTLPLPVAQASPPAGSGGVSPPVSVRRTGTVRERADGDACATLSGASSQSGPHSEMSHSRNPPLLARNWLAALLGAGAGAAVILGPLLVAGAGPQLWDCTVRFNHFYAASESFGLSALWSRMQLFGTQWWILFLLILPLVWFRPRRVGFWLGLFAAAWITTGLSWYGHYYIVIMPFWALLSAVAIAQLSSWGASRLRCPPVLLRVGLAGAALVLLCLPDIPWMVMSHRDFAFSKLDETSPFIESRTVAQRVAAVSSPGDYVFVAGSEPQILCYAKRFSPSRFINAYPLMVPTPLTRSYQQEAIGELQRHPPALIVLSRRPLSWLRDKATPPDFLDYLQKLLAENYRTLGGYVWQIRGGHWQEPLTQQDFKQASLVVYQRKTPTQ